MFRELNAEELAIVDKLKKRGKLSKKWKAESHIVDYRVTGNFTVALVVSPDGDDYQVGVAKFNPWDKVASLNTGQAIAFDRALKNAE